MFLLRIILFIAAILALNFELSFCTCARAEYEIQGECCPMCAPGNHVYWDCTVDTSTTCVPCPESSYTDEPNGLMKCFTCSMCDAVIGLRVKKACTRTADTICEPQEGFYCTDQNKHSCTLAEKHTKCNPGQYIKQTGTAFTDTICANCTDGTYSNGSLMACQPHSKCDIKGLTEIKAGTKSSDVECEESTPVALIVGVGVVLCSLMVAVTALLLYYFKVRRKHPYEKEVY
ncbi:tumor necrosis factor receptor superfamily member 14-like [Paramisgurnus dabryanus]|uniref:tumor necrosis factor receptor superfamily member 14-like n=1 Tax=Paramisgurnus dabryanus TaxID=90735 RepID=UPI0031F437EA